MANVKHTTSNGEILTTECKKLSTALRRFTAFLKEYDRYYNEMLSELNSENANVTRDTCDTETVTMTLTSDTDTYTLTIKHNAKTPDTPESEAEQTSEQEESAEHAEAEQTEAEATVQKTPSNMINDINKKFGVNCIYHDTDSIMCDNTIQIVNTHKDYILRAFENGKELTSQCPYFSKREYAIDYINNLYENGVVSRGVVFTINNSDIYDCFSDVKMTGTTAQIKYATDILNEFYKQLCNDIAFEYKMRIYDDIDVENKDYYENLNIYITILKKVLNENHARCVITNHSKFEVWGNIHRTANNFIIAYNDDKPSWVIKHLESKIRRELFGYGETK